MQFGLIDSRIFIESDRRIGLRKGHIIAFKRRRSRLRCLLNICVILASLFALNGFKSLDWIPSIRFALLRLVFQVIGQSFQDLLLILLHKLIYVECGHMLFNIIHNLLHFLLALGCRWGLHWRLTDGAQPFNLAWCIDTPRLSQQLKQLNIDR